jgi:hypothetical protein
MQINRSGMLIQLRQPTNVRCCSNSGQTPVRLECPLCANRGH